MDVITPIVDDPQAFGAIAAANSLSDVYAMGGTPQVALSFVGCPVSKLAPRTLDAILAGIADACARAGAAVVGGHTMKDSEPKCGLAVVGQVEQKHLWSHRNAQQGDALLLTKPIGTGLIGQALRAGTASEEAVAAATANMMALNDVACAVGQRFGAHSATDITGFGLLGHLSHIVAGSKLRARISASAVPLLPTALELARKGCVPGGSRRNLSYAKDCSSFFDGCDEGMQLLLADAQTSGGLLLSLPEAAASEALKALHNEGCSDAARIGTLVGVSDGRIDIQA